MFYEIHYAHFVENQNARNAKIRHTERNRTIEDLLAGKKTCPEETIYQFGTLDEHASVEDLVLVVTEFMSEFHERFGTHVHLLDWALHLDESTPHIHERHVFDCENKYGEVAPQQEKALEALGFDLPDPNKSLSRRNNRKITFDAACRKMLFEIAKRHGLDLEEEAEYGNRKYLEKQDFILAKQKEQLAAQQDRLDELTLKVSDIDIVKPVGWPRSGKTLSDTDMKYILRRMEKYGISSEKKIGSAIRIVANENRYHPIRDYLNGLQWDGTERIAHVLHHFLGAAEDEYTCEAMRIFLLGAIKRVFQPGCKFETMLCLVGGQGCGSPVATSKCCKHFEAPTEPTGETGKVHLFPAAGGQG